MLLSLSIFFIGVVGAFFASIILKGMLRDEIAADMKWLYMPEGELRAECARRGETVDAVLARAKATRDRLQALAVVRRLMERLSE